MENLHIHTPPVEPIHRPRKRSDSDSDGLIIPGRTYRVSWWDHEEDEWMAEASGLTARQAVQTVRDLEYCSWDRNSSILVERE